MYVNLQVAALVRLSPLASLLSPLSSSSNLAEHPCPRYPDHPQTSPNIPVRGIPIILKPRRISLSAVSRSSSNLAEYPCPRYPDHPQTGKKTYIRLESQLGYTAVVVYIGSTAFPISFVRRTRSSLETHTVAWLINIHAYNIPPVLYSS